MEMDIGMIGMCGFLTVMVGLVTLVAIVFRHTKMESSFVIYDAKDLSPVDQVAPPQQRRTIGTQSPVTYKWWYEQPRFVVCFDTATVDAFESAV